MGGLAGTTRGAEGAEELAPEELAPLPGATRGAEDAAGRCKAQEGRFRARFTMTARAGNLEGRRGWGV